MSVSTPTSTSKLGLFQGYGIELEYMIVNNQTLDVLPVADKLIFKYPENDENDVVFPDISWSNELTLHVVELKTTEPRSQLKGLHLEFQNHIAKVFEGLEEFGGALLPTSMHPWMNPLKETKLWPHGNRTVYNTYDRIFDCKGHGWANLQSMHINLAFNGDQEFARLHEAIRLLLPLLPALVASSPFMEGRLGPSLDTRLWHYKENQRRFGSIIGDIIPESADSKDEYQEKILKKMYKEIAPHDPEGILQHEWLNSRGAIARFDRDAIEIRTMDLQECPMADISMAYFVTSVLKLLCSRDPELIPRTQRCEAPLLKKIFLDSLQSGPELVIKEKRFLEQLGLGGESSVNVIGIFQYFLGQIKKDPASEFYLQTVQKVLQEGNLAQRILKMSGENPSKERLVEVYRKLQSCLKNGELFLV